MSSYFEKTIAAIGYTACKTNYANHESVIVGAYKLLLAYNDKIGTSGQSTAEFYFKDACNNGKCQLATDALIGGLLPGSGGKMGCNLLEVIYGGDPTGATYFKGWRDDVANRAAYLQVLAAAGIMVQSAYLSLETKDEMAYT